MPTFAPPYNQPKHWRPVVASKRQTRKRKRGQDAGDDEVATPLQASPSPEPTPRTAASAFHPVNRTDPHYIAGHPREHSLPPSPFPHAAVREPDQPKTSLEDELAKLNPPVYLPASALEDKSTSLKRRHLDNITAILHQCMRKGDWERAHRAWGLLIRTEISGRGVDIRKHGRWGIGAELRMRRGQRMDRGQTAGDDEPLFTDEGFKLARSYYERLILQYPHTQQTQHRLNATTIYPALFNIWIYSTQDRAKRARKAVQTQRRPSDESRLSASAEYRKQLRQIQTEELEEATAIASRIDELIQSPPYDNEESLLQLRGMLALYLVDLHDEASNAASNDTSELSETSGDLSDSIAVTAHKPQASAEQRRARELFTKLQAQGIELPDSTQRWLENDEDEG